MRPRSTWLREGDPRRRGVMRGLRLVLSAHNHVVVEWPATSFGYVEVATHHGWYGRGPGARGHTRRGRVWWQEPRRENANKHRGCLLLAKGETTMGRASVVAKGRDANKHQGCLLLTMGGTAMGRANTHTHKKGCQRTLWVFANHHGWCAWAEVMLPAQQCRAAAPRPEREEQSPPAEPPS